MADPLKPGSKAELWVNRKEWDKYADQLVEDAAEEWHGWKDRISTSKPGRGAAIMQPNPQPISIASLLWNHQTGRQLDITITHGKGRKGIVIRTRPASRWISSIKSAMRGFSK